MNLKYSKEEIFAELKKIMHKLFEIDEQQIKLETKLYEELDLDSIDAVDLIVHLQSLTKKKFKPEEFKAVRTVGDVVSVIYAELAKK
jgi:acyl carrier protein